MQKINVKTIPVGALETNSYLVYDTETRDAVLIDPGAEASNLLAIIEAENVNLQAVLLTHGHGDHIGAVAKIISRKNTTLWIHPDDAAMLTDAEKNLSAMLGFDIVSEHPYNELNDNDVLSFGSLKIKVLHTPGHTRGGVCFFIFASDPPILFSGDTLFCGNVGRCDRGQSQQGKVSGELLSVPVRVLNALGNTSVFSRTTNRCAKENLKRCWILWIAPVVFKAMGSGQNHTLGDQGTATKKVCSGAIGDGHGCHVGGIGVGGSADDGTSGGNQFPAALLTARNDCQPQKQHCS